MSLLLKAAVALLAFALEANAQGTPRHPAPQPRAAAATAAPSSSCSPSDWSPPPSAGALGVQEVLRDLPVTTRWVDLPISTRERLRELAEDRMEAFRSRWGGAAIEGKLKILLECPTPEMTSAMDEFYRVSYRSVLPETFTLKSVKNRDFARVLVEAYLGAYAIGRAGLTYPNAELPNRDWDGKSLFDSLLLPDRQTYEDWMRYFSRIASSVRKIDEASLTDVEKRLRQQVLFRARAGAVGALYTACELVSADGSILMAYKADKGRPVIFGSDDEVLREVNALYLPNTAMKWMDRGTTKSAIAFSWCNGWSDEDIETYVGPIASSEVAKGIKLLKAWWIERLSSDPASDAKCTVYSADDRANIWEAFSADQQFNNDGSTTMETYRAQIVANAAGKRDRYRRMARLALDELFPNGSVLSAAQRERVNAEIEQEAAFGLLLTKVAEFLDTAQGTKDGPAARTWRDAVQRNVKRLGGYDAHEAIRPEDEAAIRAMFEQVKAWISNRYKGYPVDVAGVFPLFQFRVTTLNNSSTSMATGNISFGIGTRRSLMEHYSLLLHETRHAVTGAWRANAPDKSKVRQDEGAVIEGSGVAVEELLLETFMRETLDDDLAVALYSLDYGIRDARLVGTTDATLQRYFRAGCSDPAEPDTVEFTKSIANRYGLTGVLGDNVALRPHAGTQYFQYISGGLQVLEDIAFLQNQIGPNIVPLDPFVLFACNLNNPMRNPDYVSTLKACVRW